MRACRCRGWCARLTARSTPGSARSSPAWAWCRCSGRWTPRTGAPAVPPMPSPRACSRSYVRTAPTSCCSTTGSGTHRGRWRPYRASSGPRGPAASASLRLGPGGTPVPPVPGVSVSDAQVAERTGSRSTLAFTVRLDEPTSRATSVLVSSAGGGARPGVDYIAQRVRVGFPVGVTRAVVRVPVLGDSLDEATSRYGCACRPLEVSRSAAGSARGTIRDDDAPPRPAGRHQRQRACHRIVRGPGTGDAVRVPAAAPCRCGCTRRPVRRTRVTSLRWTRR